MRKITVLIAIILPMLCGCALTHQQVVERARSKSNSELCVASIRFPEYGDVIAAELRSRNHSCDWAVTAAQVRAQDTANANFQASLQALSASMNNRAAYQVVHPVQPAQLQITPAQPLAATAYWTGQQKQVQTVTYQTGWSCEYNYAGRTFWRTFVGTCPSSVQVQ